MTNPDSNTGLPPIVHVAAGMGQGGTERSVELFVTAPSVPSNQHVVVLDQGGATADRLQARGVALTLCDGDIGRAARAIMRAGPNPVVLMNRAGRPEAKWHDLMRRLAGQATLIDINHFGWVDHQAIDLGLRGVWCVSGTALAKYLRLYGRGTPLPDLWRDLRVAVAAGHNPVADADAPLPSRAAARAMLNLPAEGPIALRVGRPDPRKWSDLITLHFATIQRAVPDLRFLFLAAPDNRAAWLRRHMGERVLLREFTSNRSIIDAALAASDVMLHYARYGESFGYAIAEAAIARIPCVALATPWGDNAQQELIQHGKTGYVATSAGEAAFYLQTLLHDGAGRRAMGQAARDWILDQYNVESAWVLLIDFINHVRAGGTGMIPAPEETARHQRQRLANGLANYHEAFPNLSWLKATLPLWGDPAYWRIFCQDGWSIVRRRLKK